MNAILITSSPLVSYLVILEEELTAGSQRSGKCDLASRVAMLHPQPFHTQESVRARFWVARARLRRRGV